MKNFFDKDVIIVLAFHVIVLSIVFGIAGVKTLMVQNALNEQCGTKYSFIQVALAGDNLSRICQTKNINK